jgi:succinate dehydrogenase/fumarate reductase cytochrome b subunit
MHKFLKIGLIVLGLLSAVLWMNLPDSDMPAAQAVGSGAMSAMFAITYILLAIAVAFSLFFTIKKTFSKTGNAKRTFMSIGAIVLIVIISYIAADGTDVTEVGDLEVNESTVKNIGMGLNVFYILTTIAVLLMVIPSIKKLLFKK